MAKKSKNPLNIFMESIGLYFSNFDKFVKYMTFPVLGQILGLTLVILVSLIYFQNINNLIEKFPNLNNIYVFLALTIIVILPGLAIFLKAFWEYLVAYGSVNSMCENMQKSGRVYDFGAHREVVNRRKLTFIGIWMIFSALSLLALCPFFAIICAIIFIYYILAFQAFTFDSELSPLGCVKKSLALIKGHFASTFMLMALTGALCYVLFPQLVIKLFDYLGVSNFFANLFVPILSHVSLPNLEQYGFKSFTELDLAFFIISGIVAQIIIEYTLPLRSILWTLWYKNLNNSNISTNLGLSSKTKNKKSRSSKKRPSERLMENSHKKFASKKLDRNILRRASEKDE